jgi:arsenate reductase-like glutaredoxin family protein
MMEPVSTPQGLDGRENRIAVGSKGRKYVYKASFKNAICEEVNVEKRSLREAIIEVTERDGGHMPKKSTVASWIKQKEIQKHFVDYPQDPVERRKLRKRNWLETYMDEIAVVEAKRLGRLDEANEESTPQPEEAAMFVRMEDLMQATRKRRGLIPFMLEEMSVPILSKICRTLMSDLDE